MADDKKPGGEKPSPSDPFVEIIWILFAIFLFIQAFNSLAGFLNSRSGGGGSFNINSPSWFNNLSLKNLLASKTKPVSSVANPIGSRFTVTGIKTTLYDSPGGKEIGSKKFGDKGTIIGGPVVYNNVKYYQVRFDDGTEGWVSEDSIGVIPGKVTPLSDVPSPIGGFVETSKPTSVLDSPGGNEVAKKGTGERAKIIEGPLVKDGVKYWHVVFDDGTEGWVAEDNLNYLELDRKPLSSVKDPLGGTVYTSKDGVSVFDSPGGREIAKKGKDTRGKVVEGPKEFKGTKYFKIRFDDGTEGWVAEADLDYVKETPKSLSSVPSLIGKQVKTSKNGVSVFDSPGGKKIGTLKSGVSGKIIEGPLVKDGVKYWHVVFDDGTEGWVAESDLVYTEEEGGLGFLANTFIFLSKLFSVVKLVIILISLILIGFIFYLYKGVVKLREEEHNKLYPGPLIETDALSNNTNPRWEKVLTEASSFNKNDWRQAIIEADIMLGDLLDVMNLPGDTMGEKLKAVEKSDFLTIDLAWEAHKFRNSIAHEGSNFMINEREVKRIIDLYRQVFEEFKII